MILLQLVWSYLKIGLFGFGGGYAMLSLIQDEIVNQRGWLTEGEFADIVAVSQMTPGPIAINSATYIGYEVAGLPGSVLATTAVCLPALVLMILITRFYLSLRDNQYMKQTISMMKPVVVGMMASAVLLLMFPRSEDAASFTDAWSWIFFLGVIYGSYKRENPILLLVYAALGGIAVYAMPGLMSQF